MADYIVRHFEDKKDKRKTVAILNISGKRIAEIWIDTRHLVCTESTLLEVANDVARKLTGGKDRQRSFLNDYDVPKMPRSGK